MRALAIAVGVWVLALPDCGGDDGKTFACQFGTDASRYCIETTTSFQGTPDCGGGTLAATCERAGTDGGCVHSLSSGGASLRQAILVLLRRRDSDQQRDVGLRGSGGTWVQP